MTSNDNNTQFEKTRRAAERKAALRKQAEEQVRNIEPTSHPAQTPEEIQQMLHELRVHQIELEMQNEELRTAQEQSKTWQAHYFDLYDLAPVGYCTVSEKGLILEANLTVATLLGTSRGPLVKQPLSRFILKEDQGIYYLHRKKLFETGEAQECELRLAKPDGALFWAHLTATTAQAEDGAPVYRVAISDITDRKQAEEAMQESEARYRQLFENAPAGIYEVDLTTGRILSVNDALCEYTGYTKDELLTINALDLLTEESQKIFIERMAGYAAGEPVPSSLEYKARSKSGREFWISINPKYFYKEGIPVRASVVARDITELKQAENALRESENKFRSFAEHSMVGIYLIQDGIFAYVNPKFAEIFGYTVEECLNNMHFRQLVYPEDFDTVQEQVRKRALGEIQSVHYAFRGIKKTGEIIHVEIFGSSIMFHGRPTVTGTMLDITERKLAEEQLKESEDFLNRTGEIARVGGWYLSGKFDKVFWTQTTGRIHELPDGYYPSLEEAINYYHPDYRALVTECVEAAINEGKPFNFQTRLITAKGNQVWVQAIGHPEMENGKCVRLSGTFQDITENKKAEESLRKSEAIKNTMVSNIGDVIVIIDQNGINQYKSPNVTKLFGWKPEELVGKSTWDNVHPDDLSAAQKFLGTIATEPNATGATELRYRRKDGSYVWIEITVANLLHDKDIQGVLGNYHDITERKQAEEALQRKAHDLRESQRIAHVGSWRLDVATNQVVWTEELYNMYGFDPSLPPPPYTEHMKLFTPESWERLSTALAHTRETGIPYTLELKTIRKDGSNGWLWVKGEADVDSAGKTVEIWGAAQDITERKRAEEEITTLSLRQEEILAAIPNLIMEVDQNKVYTWANSAGFDFFGEDVIGREAADYFEGEQATYNTVQPLFQGDENTIYVESWQRRKDGQKRLLAWWCRVLKDQEGDVLGALSSAYDITEKWQAEEAVARAAREWQTTFDTLSDAVWILDRGHRVLRSNSAAESIFGRPTAAFIGKHCWEIVHGTNHPIPECPILRAKHSLQRESMELQVGDAWFEVVVDPILSADGQYDGAVHIVSEITERKLAETYREMGHEILRILNEPGDLQESIYAVLAALKTRTEVDAVGLRLQEGEDFPYFAQDGFSKDFLLAENTLLERGKDGGVCRDKDGNVNLECTCGLVISGKTDPSNPLFTKGGSCWTNDSLPLLDLPSDQDPRLHPRNNCIHQGYATVALIPVRTTDGIVGLLQLNDKRKDRFTIEIIEMLEDVAAHIGSALMRKRAEEELFISKENFRRSLDDSPLGVRIVTAEGETIYTNRAILDIYGYDNLEEFKTTPTRNRHTPQSYDEFKIRMEKRKRGEDVPSEYDISIVRQDGEVRHLQVFRKEILWDGERQFQVIYQDITKRKQAEEDLREKSHLNQILLDAFPCVALLLRPQTREIISSNAAAVKVGAVPGTHCFSTWGQRHDPCPWCLAPALWATGEAQHLEVEALGIFWGAHWIPVTEDLYMHFAFDITERKQVEEELRKSEELLNAIQRLTKVGGWEWNVETQTMYWTEETYLIHDFVPDEMVPGSVEHIARSSECYETEDRLVILAAFQRCVEEGQPYDFDFPFTSAKGRRLWIRTTAEPVLESGKIIRVIGNIMDITERKRAEEKLKASQRQLLDLAERLQQIREEERILVSREIHDVIGGGLTGLKMDLSWLIHNVKNAESDKEQAAFMSRIVASSEFVDQMIKETRRISSGLRPPFIDDLGLISAVDWQLSEFTSRTGIQHELTTQFEHVNMEKEKAVGVFRIFQETLTNIARHSRATKVVVVLREDERSLFGDENLVLEIRDNGRGISEEEVLDSKSLGLLGMKERAVVFGGQFSIRVEPGGGTTVVLKIPRKKGETS